MMRRVTEQTDLEPSAVNGIPSPPTYRHSSLMVAVGMVGVLSVLLAIATWRVITGPTLGTDWFDLVPGLPAWASALARIDFFLAAVTLGWLLLRTANGVLYREAPTLTAIDVWFGVAVLTALAAVFWTNAMWVTLIRLGSYPDWPPGFGGGLRSREDFTVAGSLYTASCLAAGLGFIAVRRAAAAAIPAD